MMDPSDLQDQASHSVLHAWIAVYLSRRGAGTANDANAFSSGIQEQAQRLRESAIQLQLALEKMRIANEKLALRMAEHKAFFAKYKVPQKYRAPE